MRSIIVKSIALLAVSICWLSVAGAVPARAEALYAVDGFNANDTRLYILDPATGKVLQNIGLIGFPNVTGIAFHPTTGVLYGVTSRFTGGPGGPLLGAELITIDLVSGVGTFVGYHDADIADIAFDSAGTLYAWVPVEASPFCCDALGAIDLASGALGLVWNADFFTPGFDAGTGLAFDANGTLFVKATTGDSGPGNLFSVDASPSPMPGIFLEGVEPRPPLTTLSLSGPNHDNGLAFDANGTLYTIGRLPFFGSGQLLVIDPTVQASNVAEVGLNTLVNISAIAFQPAQDADNDGVLDVSDNCPDAPNPDQADNDSDALGDACDSDDDNDGVDDATDNCQFTSNPNQADFDVDGLGDACDADADGDGIVVLDNCPFVPNALQEDNDGDGAGDACDADDDNDGVDDATDNCPFDQNPDQADLDGDGIGDICDADIDNDGVVNESDNCVSVANVGQEDTDTDGDGDACDADDDNDGVDDASDNCSLIANPDQLDLDLDGRGDACDGDLDGDSVTNDLDNCPVDANANQFDFDVDGEGDVCDPDIDDDGIGNTGDICQFTPLDEVVDPGTGCSIAQLCPCEGPRGTTTPWQNHGTYTSCAAKSAESFVNQGLITEVEKDAIAAAAAGSSCGAD